jgi:hypothetical protein
VIGIPRPARAPRQTPVNGSRLIASRQFACTRRSCTRPAGSRECEPTPSRSLSRNSCVWPSRAHLSGPAGVFLAKPGDCSRR